MLSRKVDLDKVCAGLEDIDTLRSVKRIDPAKIVGGKLENDWKVTKC